ncbi:hypothetical protein Tco_0718293 [Tanacetum coccineum]
MIKSSNKDTPFSLTYGTEAVILAEIGMPTLRIAKVDLVQNNEALEINLGLQEERREQATIREAKSKAKMERYYNSKVRSVSFKPEDLVYRNNKASRVEDTGKLGPKWEWSYEVTEALGKGAYKLRDRDRNQLPRTWNISNLKKCYVHKMYGYCKNLKKTVKTGQSRTRDGKECTRAEDLIARKVKSQLQSTLGQPKSTH